MAATTEAPGLSRRRALVEAVLPVALVQAYVWSVARPRPAGADLLFAVVLLALLVGLVRCSGPHSWRSFGLARGADHRKSLLPVGLLTLGCVAALLVGGLATQRLQLSRGWLTTFLTYPFSGALQQALALGVLHPRCRRVVGERAAPLLTALLFALAHLPNPLLVLGGGLLQFAYARLWDRHPSLPVIACSHGIIGAVAAKCVRLSMRVGLGA